MLTLMAATLLTGLMLSDWVVVSEHASTAAQYYPLGLPIRLVAGRGQRSGQGVPGPAGDREDQLKPDRIAVAICRR